MEGNKDEAAKCVAMAKKVMLTGDFGKAQRLLERAHRMFPSAECETLAAACRHKLLEKQRGTSRQRHEANLDKQQNHRKPNQQQRHSGENKECGFSCAPTAAGAAGGAPADCSRARQRRSSPLSSRPARSNTAEAPAASTRAGAPSSSGAHTPEQVRLCEVVLRERCYYSTLGVSKDASEETIRKAYRRLALMLHPDKNKAPRAEEAFKRVNRVSKTLLDAQERHIYDVSGADAVEGRPQAQQRSAASPDIMTAEDLFRVLFGHSLRDNGRVDHTRASRAQHEETNLQAAVKVLPMLLLFLMMFLFNLMPHDGTSPTAFYSLRQTREFPIARTTQSHSVRYYVGDSFMREILPQPDRVRELERIVEMRHYQGLCSSENDRLHRELTSAHYHMASNEAIKRLLDRPRPGCMKLELLKRSAGGGVTSDSRGT